MAKLVPEVEKKSEVEQKTEITQADIEAFIKNWNGDISSKQRVNEYMTEHGRERGTAAWLANEYGNNDDMFTVTYEGLQPVELTWVKVQRALIQMVSNDTFLDENERSVETDELIFEEMSDEDKEDFIQMIDMTRDYGESISENEAAIYDKIMDERREQPKVVEVAEQPQEPVLEAPTVEATEPEEPTPEVEDYSQYIGREIEVDDRRFVVEHINDVFDKVELRDITFQNNTGFPIFRSESLEWLKRVMELQEQTSEPIQTDAIPVTESNIAIEPIAADAPEPTVGNFHITDDNLGVGGAKAKFRANI